MIKRILLALVLVLAAAGALAGAKALQIKKMIAQAQHVSMPPATVTAEPVRAETWDTLLTAVGSLTAVQGVTVSSEMAGKVVEITFESGAKTSAGDILARLDTSTEEAQLRAAESTATLARINLERNADLLRKRTISRAEYDNAEAEHTKAVADADIIRAAIAKKTIRAPFSGRLGIRQVNLGQVVGDGDPLVSLQSMDPVYVDFYLPQQELDQLRVGLDVRITSDAFEGREAVGKLTAINTEIDADTRNIRLQATVANPDGMLRPGMFVNTAVVLPAPTESVVVPSTAVLYAPYSDSVFVIEQAAAEQNGTNSLALRQQLVKLGERRGDFVAIEAGVKPGETVVSTGVFKLRNGQAVVVDNTLAPEFDKTPSPENT